MAKAAPPSDVNVPKAQEFNYRKNTNGDTVCDVRVKERLGSPYVVVATGVKSGTYIHIR